MPNCCKNHPFLSPMCVGFLILRVFHITFTIGEGRRDRERDQEDEREIKKGETKEKGGGFNACL